MTRCNGSDRQRFYVSCYCAANGETWEVSVPADDPEHALAIVLRRRLWVQRLMSEDAFQFVVSHAPVPTAAALPGTEA